MQRIQKDIACGSDVLVLVPEQFSFEEEKKLYDFLGAEAFNQLHTFSFVTLSKHILRLYGKNARAEHYVNDREKLIFLHMAVQNALQHGELLSLTSRNTTSEFLEQLLSLLVKIRKAGVTSQKLCEVSQNLPVLLREKTSDIAMILLEYDRILEAHGLYDSLTDLTEAAAIANIQNFFKGKTIYIDEFDSFTGDQYDMLDVILAQADHVTAAIRTDEPNARISPVFEGGNRTFRALMKIARSDYRIPVETEFCDAYLRSEHSDLAAVSTKILRPQTVKAEYGGHVHIMEAHDPISEAEYIGATICRLLAEDASLRCSDIAVAVKSLDEYGSVLERALARYELPYHISSANPVMHTELMRYFLTLLALLADGTWDTDTILRYLKNPFSAHPQVTVSMLEHFCFTWSIAQEDWLVPFYAEDSENRQRAEPFGGEALETIRKNFVAEIQTLSEVCKGQTVRTVCKELYRHLCRKQALHRERFEAMEVLEQREFTTLWNMLMEIMDTVVSCCGEQTMDFSELREIFGLMIAGSSFSVPPQTLDAIQIVEAQTARLNAPKIVFVPGVVEDAFPGEIKLGGMFTRKELEELSENGITISRMFFELYSDERLIVHKLFSAPTQQLYLSYPCVNNSGEAVQPSMVIRQTCAMFSEETDLLLHEQDIPLTYFVRTPAAAYFHFVRNMQRDDAEVASIQQILAQHPLYAARIEKLVTADTAPIGNVQPETMQKLLGDTLILSASKIETYFECPFRYYCKHCLKLYLPEKIDFSSRNLGNLAHFCFEQILRKYDLEAFTALTAAQLQAEINQLSELFSAQNLSDAVCRDSRFRLNYHMAGRGLLKVLQHMQKELRDGQFMPIGFEVEMGTAADTDSSLIPPLRLRDGAIQCIGKIDRVDLCEQDAQSFLRVVDYKTGERAFAPEKLARGLDMQMLIYLFALKRSGAYPNTESGGVLYMPSGQLNLKYYHEREDKKTKETAEILDEYYRMKGLLLDTAAGYMEPEITASHIPVLDRKENDSSLYTVSPAQMERLEHHVMDKICEMHDGLHEGNIAPDPYLNIPCGYCKYTDLCGVEIQKPKSLLKAEMDAAIASVFEEKKQDEEEENA